MIRTALLMLAAGGFAMTSSPAGATQLVLTIAGVRPSGKVLGQVFADAASFKARAPAVLRFAVEPEAGIARATLALPPGRYAIALFQDTGSTGKLETNFLGVPVVPYGFSNNARGTFGPPEFDAAAFQLGASPMTLSVDLR